MDKVFEVKRYSKEVNLLRNKCWINYLLVKSGCDSVQKLNDKYGISNDATSLYSYINETVTVPRGDKINLAEKLFPGSKDIWLYGCSSKLPFWGVLNKDIRDSEEVFFKVLGSGSKGGYWMLKYATPLYKMKPIEKVTAFLQELLPNDVWFLESDYISKYGREPISSFETKPLIDILDSEVNYIDILYDKEKSNIVLDKFDNFIKNHVYTSLTDNEGKSIIKGFDIYEPEISKLPFFTLHNPDIVLALIASMVIYENSDKERMFKKLYDYIVIGLENPVMNFQLTYDDKVNVYQYILDNF